MGIEQYDRKPATEENKKEITVKDLLADKKQSALFGDFVHAKAPKGDEIAERMLKGEATTADREELVKQMEPFLRQQQEVARISKAMTPDLVKRLVDQSPKLKILAKEGGVEGIRGTVLSQLEIVAMRDPSRFDKMVSSYDQLIEKTNVINAEIEEMCKENNIDMDEYLKILENPDEAERQQALYNKVKGEMGVLKRYWRGEKVRKEIASKATSLNMRDDIDILKKEYNFELESVGDLLAASVNENKDLNDAFNRVVFNEKGPEKEQIGSFEEMRGMMPSAEDLEKELEEAKAKSVSQDYFEKKYFDSYRSKTGDKKGAWNDVITKFIKGAIKDFF